jgi:hypothetical protein
MFTVTALAACLVASAAGCVFDCESNVCGGAPVVYVNRSFSFPASSASQYGMFAAWEWTALGLHSLDLSGRGITAIAPGGLRCYFELDSVGDDDSAYRPNSTQVPGLPAHVHAHFRFFLPFFSFTSPWCSLSLTPPHYSPTLTHNDLARLYSSSFSPTPLHSPTHLSN